MQFGVFDHMDDGGVPLDRHYENRLRLVEAYDRAGFHGYHVAEHHSTPLGVAASPGIFLAAVAQRTKRLRFGPLVYPLPFYHPLRLIEEVCMLDRLSGGRLELGVGRGVSPFETEFYGIDFSRSQAMYHEAFQVLIRGLTAEVLTFEGEFFRFRNVPMILKPLQRPHPPLWYGLSAPENADWPAAHDVNVVTLGLRPRVRAILDRYREVRSAQGKDPAKLPLLGVSRHVVVAPTDAAALAAARRAYPKWRESFGWLWKRQGTSYQQAAKRVADLYPDTFDELQAIGNGVAGSPAAVRAFVAEEVAATGINYFAPWLAFGDLSLQESLRSVELFAGEVMPTFAPRPMAAQ